VFFGRLGADFFALCWMALISGFFFVDLALVSLFFDRFGMEFFALCWMAWISLFCLWIRHRFLCLFNRFGMHVFAFCWMAGKSVFFFCGFGVDFYVFLVDLARLSLLCIGWHRFLCFFMNLAWISMPFLWIWR